MDKHRSHSYIFTSIILIVVLQTIALVGMIAIRQWTLNTGTPILLETTPIDPRSLFAGDYVQLHYKISDIEADYAFIQKLKINQTVYVVLTQNEKYWTATAIDTIRPETRTNQLVIKGRVVNIMGNMVQVSYGIENYFVPEGEGKKIERPQEGDIITIKAVVDRFGNAAIAGLLLNGKEVFQEKLF